ncbi:hypothetical protein DERP_011701 [Dermatophagoides pteronyssinus]|uniref:Uncharacterized protein n=1 Tax=Dermatophagoides pteronyssinus TaxID=6956 RepID=A0ABQ8J392_DERPT|nr:hypothetical protein DERP_011701 [Dermatophagoides pteronyssinus]
MEFDMVAYADLADGWMDKILRIAELRSSPLQWLPYFFLLHCTLKINCYTNSFVTCEYILFIA